jgi:glutamate-1-semialdehyde 2,1-aminomutase
MSKNKDLAKFSRSLQLFSKSRHHLAGGVSSAMRGAALPSPLFFSSGLGPRLKDADSNEYLDYTLAWGPLILGHSHPAILSAVGAQLQLCQTIGAQHELEISVAEKICQMVPCAEQVIFSNTGSEAVQSALRLARAFTGKFKIIRFEGHYHGWIDNVLSGYRPDLNPDKSKRKLPTEGMNPNAADETIILPWNNLREVEATLERHHTEIAAIITEPILCNSSCLLPAPGYLQGLRDLATQYGVVLIFDEVITGFRVAHGGAQALFDVKPDLAIFAKALAGGFPLSAVAGKQEIMELVEQRRVVHAGTFNGNPIVLAAAQATLEILDASQGKAFTDIRKNGETLMRGIRKAAEAVGIPLLINGVGSAFHVSFTTQRSMANYRDTLDTDTSARDQFLLAMLSAGIYLMPDGRWYVSLAHGEKEVTQTLAAVDQVFSQHGSELTRVQHSR